MGVPLEHQGVAPECKFPEEEVKDQTLGRATWYRRRGTPAIILHLGVPLESQAWHANAQPLTWVCHLVSKAWHASYHSSLGRAT